MNIHTTETRKVSSEQNKDLYESKVEMSSKAPEKAPLLASPGTEGSPVFEDEEGHVLTPEEIAQNARAKTSLIIAIVFCVIFMIVEFVFGLMSHSLAILSDAAHMLTDVGSLILALIAVIYSGRAATAPEFTFGFQRAEVVGALFSVLLVWGLVGVISVEGVGRVITIVECAGRNESKYTQCEKTEPKIMLIIGCCGLLVNIGYAAILTWGGAEVQHAHSHGDGGGDDHDDDHGHSHGGGGGGCSSSSSPKVAVVKCCTPSVHELACDNETHGHEHLKNHQHNSYGGAGSVASMSTCGGGNINEDRDHDRDHHDHGHSHAHGGSCGGGHNHHDDDDDDHQHHNEHGHSHASADSGGCGGGHDGHHGHSHDHHGHDHHGHGHGHGEEGDEEASGGGNMNIKGAALHALGDCLQSIGVIIAAIIIWVGAGPEGSDRSYYNLADPVCSLFFCAITLWATKGLFLEVFAILMERAPRGMHRDCFKRKLEHIPTVLRAEHLKMWCITNNKRALSAHLVVPWTSTASDMFAVLAAARELGKQHGFTLCTFELVQGPEVVSVSSPASATASTPSALPR